MEPALKAKWVAALRSGMYQQGRLRLRSLDDKYCCMGVLCEVAGIPGECGRGVYVYGTGEHASEAILTDRLAKSVGLSTRQVSTLCGLNDGVVFPPQTFSQIAEWVEANL